MAFRPGSLAKGQPHPLAQNLTTHQVGWKNHAAGPFPEGLDALPRQAKMVMPLFFYLSFPGRLSLP